MAFDIGALSPHEAADISDIHLKAMNSNPLLHVQFPTKNALEDLRVWLTGDTMKHLEHADKTMLVARDRASGRVVSFIKWQVYARRDFGAPEIDVGEEWPESCRREYLNRYEAAVQEVLQRVMGHDPYYRESLSDKQTLSAVCAARRLEYYQ
jgi:hypothetical protein